MNAKIVLNFNGFREADRLMDFIMALLQEYTPVDTGELLSSLYRRHNVIGFSAPYAVYVHEQIDNLHKPPTRAKFLEDAAVMAAAVGDFKGRIGISYEPLEIYIDSTRGAMIYTGRG